MIPLFTEVPAGAQAVFFPPQTDYVMRGLKQNVQVTHHYWQHNLKAAKTNLFLTRLLQTLDVPLNWHLHRYYSALDGKALTKSMALKMTSSIYKGQAFHGIFYADPTVEYLIADDSPIDPTVVHQHWRTYPSVEVLAHPKSDLHLVLPCADNYSVESGLAVIKIHLPALAIQYRAFLLEEGGDPDGSENTQMFIERFVLPNMLPSQTEVALFNRLMARISGNYLPPLVNSLAKTPFQLPFMESKLDNVLDDVMANYKSVDPTFEKLLRNTPAVFAKDALVAFQLPKLAMTAQIEWLLIAARLKHYYFLLQLCGPTVLRQNQLEVSQLMRSFRDPAVFSQFDAMPYEAGETTRFYMQAVMDAAKRQSY